MRLLDPCASPNCAFAGDIGRIEKSGAQEENQPEMAGLQVDLRKSIWAGNWPDREIVTK